MFFVFDGLRADRKPHVVLFHRMPAEQPQAICESEANSFRLPAGLVAGDAVLRAERAAAKKESISMLRKGSDYVKAKARRIKSTISNI